MATLSEDERARASGFRFDRDRKRFIAGRGLLREILGRLLRVEASRLVFSYTASGKPILTTPPRGQSVHFNLAHAGSCAVYAVTLEHEVGIDLERLREIEGAEQLVERVFSEREAAQWRSVPRPQQAEAFFNCWTRKEACLKATGQGISEFLTQIEVSLIPGQPAGLVGIVGDSQAPTHWLLESLAPAAAYVGAVALPRGRQLRVNAWKWQPMDRQ